MKKFIKFVFYSKHSVLTIYLVLVMTMAIRMYFVSGKLTSDLFNEQMLHRQTIVARIGAHHVNDLLEDWGYDLAIFSEHIKDSVNDHQKIQDLLQENMTKYENMAVSGMVVVDKNGKVIANVNRSGIVDLGKSVSDRDYFIWGKTAQKGNFFYSKPLVSRLGLSEGKLIFTATTPILNPKFDGVVTLAVDIREFAEKYLTPLKVTEDTRVYLIDKKGDLVYSEYKPLEGKNYFEILSSQNFEGKKEAIDNFKIALGSEKEGKIIVNLPNVETKQLDKFLISYSPVVIRGNTQYTIAIATPVAQSNFFLWPMYNNQFRVLVVFTCIVVGFAIIQMTTVAISNKRSYEKGFIKGKEDGNN